MIRTRFHLAAAVLFGLTLVVPQVSAQHAIESEAWIEMRKMFRAEGPPPSVEEDVAALAGPGARKAGPRLIDRGPQVLPAVHAALRTADVESREFIALLQVIQPLADESSVPVVLELLRDGANPQRRSLLLTLAHLPPTDAAWKFVRDLAAGDEAWRTRRMAFTWFAFQRDARGRPFAEALLQAEEIERRATGLWVLARLKDPAALAPIAEILQAGAPSSYRDVLLLSLAELATPQQFEAHAPQALAWSSGFKDAARYVRYRAAPVAERPEICKEMLRARMPGHREIAVRCLLDAGQAGELRPLAALDLEAPGMAALLRNEIRRAGWCILDTDSEFLIEPPSAAGRCR